MKKNEGASNDIYTLEYINIINIIPSHTKVCEGLEGCYSVSNGLAAFKPGYYVVGIFPQTFPMVVVLGWKKNT